MWQALHILACMFSVTYLGALQLKWEECKDCGRWLKDHNGWLQHQWMKHGRTDLRSWVFRCCQHGDCARGVLCWYHQIFDSILVRFNIGPFQYWVSYNGRAPGLWFSVRAWLRGRWSQEPLGRAVLTVWELLVARMPPLAVGHASRWQCERTSFVPPAVFVRDVWMAVKRKAAHGHCVGRSARSGRANRLYCSDFCAKNQEFLKGHVALMGAYARRMSDAYCKGIVRGRVDGCNLHANHTSAAKLFWPSAFQPQTLSPTLSPSGWFYHLISKIVENATACWGARCKFATQNLHFRMQMAFVCSI